MMADIAFLITRSPGAPDPAMIVERAQALSLSLTVSDDAAARDRSEISSFSFDNNRAGIMMCTFLPVHHPDAANMARGPLSPDEVDIRAAASHMILVGFGIEGTDAERDELMFLFTAAVCGATEAVGALVGPAVNFQKADVFIELAGLIPEHGVPSELAITVSAEQVDDRTMSILTHGLRRYGRSEFLLIAPIDDSGSMSLVFDMARWSMEDPALNLPSGDTVGRTEDEKLLVGRRPHPHVEGAEVITLTPTRE